MTEVCPYCSTRLVHEEFLFPHTRWACTVLDEMRNLLRERHSSPLLGLVEEMQTIANRMEAAIGDRHDVTRYARTSRALKEEIKMLREEKASLDKVDTNDPEDDDEAWDFG